LILQRNCVLLQVIPELGMVQQGGVELLQFVCALADGLYRADAGAQPLDRPGSSLNRLSCHKKSHAPASTKS
jgi:hypothetical protein